MSDHLDDLGTRAGAELGRLVASAGSGAPSGADVRRRATRRQRACRSLVAIGLVVASGTAAVVLDDGGPGDPTVVASHPAGQPGEIPAPGSEETTTTGQPEVSTTTVTTVDAAPASTTTTTVPPDRRVVASGEGWSVARTSGADGECLEIRTTRLERRCGLRTPSRLVEAAAVIPIGAGGLFVALTKPDAEALHPEASALGANASMDAFVDYVRVEDPFLADAGLLINRNRRWIYEGARHQLYLSAGQELLGFVRLTRGAIRIGKDLDINDDPSIFRHRPGFRQVSGSLIGTANAAGGIYDGNDGSRCVIILALPWTSNDPDPAVISDRCGFSPQRQPIEQAAFHSVRPFYPGYQTDVDVYYPSIVFSADVATWECILPSGELNCLGSLNMVADPTDPGFKLAYTGGAFVFAPAGIEQVTVVAYDAAGHELARTGVALPGQ